LATDNRPPSDVRKSALWGTGNRGGEHRSSALWGRGGRGAVTALVAAFVLLAPIAAFAGGGNGNGNKGPGGNSGSPGWQKKYGGATDGGIADSTFVQDSLWQQAKQHGNDKIHVIVQSVGPGPDVNVKIKGVGAQVRNQLNLIGAVSLDLPAGKLQQLAKQPNLIITPDSPVHSTGLVQSLSSTQLWPYVTGNAAVWNTLSNVPTIAVVDSGLDAGRIDFGNRAYPQVNFSSRSPNATGDQRGHGTFVAGIAAGSAPGFAGAAPGARILPIRVMDQNGVALTSDVINALQWLAVNKSTYNVRVVNLSLHSGTATHFYFDPLDRAAEKLWFGGVVVVAAAGNYGTAGSPSGVPYSPGNDPFVITVGAADLGTSFFKYDDTAAPWSAYGYTEDGFAKPEIGAPGRYIVGPVPLSSTLGAERPDHIVQAGYMQLSGTSFAAPVVAGTVAQMLAKHPSWTPDQVKGVLMVTATSVPSAARLALGVGELNAYKAVNYGNTPPNPNRALDAFARTDTASGGVTFDYASWADVAHASASWADASWADASWADASWADASWADASWNDASWADASWADASWADASWADASWADSAKEDAAEGETDGSTPVIDPQTAAALQANPDLALGTGTTGGAASPTPIASDTVTPTPTLPETGTSAVSDTTQVVVPTVAP
jgi:serine protease AprX